MNSSQIPNSENTDADGQQVYNISEISTENVTARVETNNKKEKYIG
jgi:hypothetical protein